MGQGLYTQLLLNAPVLSDLLPEEKKEKKVKESEGETCWLFKPLRRDPSQREGEGGGSNHDLSFSIFSSVLRSNTRTQILSAWWTGPLNAQPGFAGCVQATLRRYPPL